MKNRFIKLIAVSLFAVIIGGCAINADLHSDSTGTKKVTVNATIYFQGANPAEFIDAAANAGGTAKAAILGSDLELVSADWEYKVKAHCLSDNTKPDVLAALSGSDGKKFSITLDSPARWQILTYVYFPGNEYAPENSILVDTMEINLTNDDPIPDILIKIKPDSSASSNSGSYELTFDTSTWSTLKINKAVVNIYDSGNNICDTKEVTQLNSIISNDTLFSGVYTMRLEFLDQYDSPLYSCTETLNIYGGFKTTRWWGKAPYLFPDNADNPTKYTFKITDELIGIFNQKNIYIKADSGPDYESGHLKKDGTALNPYSTIKAAFERLKIINNGTSQYKIIFLSDLICDEAHDAVSNGTNGYSFGVYDSTVSNSNLNLIIESSGGVHTIKSDRSGGNARFFLFNCNNTRVCNVTIKNLIFKDSRCYKSGGFLYTVGTGRHTLILDNVHIKNTYSNGSGGAFYLGNGSFKMLNGSVIGDPDSTAAPQSHEEDNIIYAMTSGGAIFSLNSTITIGEGCVISRCYTDTKGGAICSDNQAITLKGCTIKNTTAKNNGGAINISNPAGKDVYLEDSIIKNCKIVGFNSTDYNADSKGSAIYPEGPLLLHIKGRSYIDIANDVVMSPSGSKIQLESDMTPQAENYNYVARIAFRKGDATPTSTEYNRNNQPFESLKTNQTQIVSGLSVSYLTENNLKCFALTSTQDEYNDYPASAGKLRDVSYKYCIKLDSTDSPTKGVVADNSGYSAGWEFPSFELIPSRTVIARDSSGNQTISALTFTVKESSGQSVTITNSEIAIYQGGYPIVSTTSGALDLNLSRIKKLPAGTYELYMRAGITCDGNNLVVDRTVPLTIIQGLDAADVTVELLKEMSEMSGLGTDPLGLTPFMPLYLTSMPTDAAGLLKFNKAIEDAKIYLDLSFIPVNAVSFSSGSVFGGTGTKHQYIRNLTLGPGITFGNGYMLDTIFINQLKILSGVTKLGKINNTGIRDTAYEDTNGLWYSTTNSSYTGGQFVSGTPGATTFMTAGNTKYWYKVSN
ncbi:MAG: right-handed parallel beta-helix repeat-containing protein [Treponema sp.]|nr:right-handed parallel beta-helix repeat-containing protein [Treponema sp.]